ncbi:MAG: radical SAM protein [Planctomycetota bacterium]
MKTMTTSCVYVLEGSDTDKRCADRMGRMMRGINAESVRRVTCEELDRIAAERKGRFGAPGRPDVIFCAFQWRSPEEDRELQERYPHLGGSLRLAWGADVLQMGGGAIATPLIGAICRPFWTTGPMIGCYHACTYCMNVKSGRLLVTLNVEQLVERHEAITKCAPWQRHWHTGGNTDIFCFEPEYGFTELMLDSAARLDRYVLFYTSSDNVGFLLNMRHRDRAIIEWTISPRELTRFEAKAPSLEDRLRAMQMCRDAGCIVRCQFAPFVPLAGWRQHYRELIRELLAAVEPDMIAIHMLRCPHPVSEAIRQWFGPDSLDPEYAALVAEAEAGGRQASFPGNHIFPYEARAVMNRFVIEEIRNAGSDLPIALCRETPEMWEEFKDSLRLGPEMCGCGCPPRFARTKKSVAQTAG